ncbi:predicted protein [Thalassiosira pseudonana CCMP1335]|uniref:Uncharacterized protein n=1 Tax=Thalassiosira pseudonana TaxID=35128 RepID=B8C1F1_THAPS|nr:predicted protein [Thalassiosira pseudonana CCMP1335]EED93232.1 predicted protein [Thalassiosira pseudonana CCMP1335]
MSLHKVMKSKNSTRDEWTEHLKTPTGLGKWHTVLDFFLYNNQFLRNHPDYPNPWGRNPFNVTKHEKVRRAMEILNQHFDVVSIADHAQYKRDILEMTGWIDMEIPHSNVYKKEIEFTKKEVETLQKRLTLNGDIDFIEMVKMRYQWPLSFLQDSLRYRMSNGVEERDFVEDSEDDDDDF